mgnify:CR=1 FL=1
MAPALNYPLVFEVLFLLLALAFSRGGKQWWFNKYQLAACFLLAVTLLRAGIAWLAQPHFCGQMQGFVGVLECYFQAATNQNSVLRQASMLFVAFAVFIMTWQVCQYQRFSQLVSRAILTTQTLFCFICLTAFLLSTNQVLPKSIFFNEFGSKKLTVLLQNPSWIWPYLMPGILLLFWQFWEWMDNAI